MADLSRALFNRGLLFDEVELNWISTALGDEILARTANLVRTPGVFLPNGALTDTQMKVVSPDVAHVHVNAGVAIDDLGQLIEVLSTQQVAVTSGTWALIAVWAYTDSTAGTFSTGNPPSGSTYTRRARSYTLSVTAWPNAVAHSVLLAKVEADGINPCVVTDYRTPALLHWSNTDWTSVKSAVANMILQQGIPAVRLDQGTGSTYFLTAETPASSGATVTIAAGQGLTTAAEIVKITTPLVLAVTNDNTYHLVRLVPSSTFGGESTAELVADGSTGGFYVARVKRNGTTLTVADVRTKLWLRSMSDSASLPVTPIRLRASWGFENSQRQRGALDSIPVSGHIQGVLENVWVKVKFGDGGTGTIAAGVLTKVTNEVGAWTNDEWIGHYIRIGSRYYLITDNTSTTITFDGDLTIGAATAFEIVTGGSLNVCQLQSKWPSVAIGVSEITECDAVRSTADVEAAGYYTVKTNDTWTTAQVFQEMEQQQGGVNYERGSVGREFVWHNLPAGVPYRVRVQARGGPTAEFWSAWSSYVIAQPLAPAAKRALLVPTSTHVTIKKKPGGMLVVVDFSSCASNIKAAADAYYAATEVYYTEGESLSGVSDISASPAATPVPYEPWASISTQTVQQMCVAAHGRNIQIMTEPLARVRIVIRHVLRDGTCTASKEFAIESGSQVCVDARTATSGYGTQPLALDSTLSMLTGGRGGVSGGIVPITAYLASVGVYGLQWQTVRTCDMRDYFGSANRSGGSTFRVVGLSVTALVGGSAAAEVQVQFAGTGTNKVYTLTLPQAGVNAYLSIDEVVSAVDQPTMTMAVRSTGATPGTPAESLNIELVTVGEPN